jgi:dinuclear metal center YbgI/SA1388 family protein
MVSQRELVAWLDKFLDVNSIKDRFCNGLQVTGKEEVTRIALAVDPCLDVIEKAVSAHFDMLITHHSLLSLSGRLLELECKRLRPMLSFGMNVYCCHLPLDRHPIVGNNASLAKTLGLQVKGEFGLVDGKAIGCWAKYDKPISLSEFEAIVKDKLKTEAHARKFGSDSVERVGIVSGGGGYHVREASELGLDTVLTGDFSHHAVLDAKDLKINLVMAGQYGTEKLGVQEVGRKIHEKFPDLEVEFIDNPTGF